MEFPCYNRSELCAGLYAFVYDIGVVLQAMQESDLDHVCSTKNNAIYIYTYILLYDCHYLHAKGSKYTGCSSCYDF